MRLGLEWPESSKSTGLELLARHHGLPSPFLDWTESPYIGAYFAYRAGRAQPALLILDRARLPENSDFFEIIHDVELLRFNRRALRQKGFFVRVAQANLDAEKTLGDALTKLRLPIDRDVALADLDEMSICESSLFPHPDGAARTAEWRVRSMEASS